jgi:hypothetical protein
MCTGKSGLKSTPNQVRVISKQQKPLCKPFIPCILRYGIFFRVFNSRSVNRPSRGTPPIRKAGNRYISERVEIRDENQVMHHLIYFKLNEKRQIHFV